MSMRLADFILENMEAILVEWKPLHLPGNRRPIHDMIRLPCAITEKDPASHCPGLDHPADAGGPEQKVAGPGRAVPEFDAKETAAQTHAILRARSGFNINQLASEYRALVRVFCGYGWTVRRAPTSGKT